MYSDLQLLNFQNTMGSSIPHTTRNDAEDISVTSKLIALIF